MSAGVFDEVESLLTRTASAGIRPGLERMERLLRLMNDPQDRFQSFHIVGTNGKGSTCAFLASALREAGYATALYTSPHLESPGERLLINGSQLDGDKWLAAVRETAAVVKGDPVLSSDPPSYFEILTAAAFLLAAGEGVEAGVIEAGLGGRLDATNLLHRAACSVVTSVSMDHMEFLGDTLEAIAGEKFAVVRPGVPACFMGDNPDLIPLFREFCSRRGAVPFVASVDSKVGNAVVTESGCSFDFHSPRLELSGVHTRMTGRYQLDNAALALSALSCALDAFPALNGENIKAGMEAARWPGRLEIVSDKPLIVLDGGHNADGVDKLTRSARELWPGRKWGVVYAAMRDKDYNGCLGLLNGLNRPALYPTEVPGMARCLPAAEMRKAAEGWTWANDPGSFASPMDAAGAALSENDNVLICGSLYLIGWIRHKITGIRDNNSKGV